jgi:hypothetical protein
MNGRPTRISGPARIPRLLKRLALLNTRLRKLGLTTDRMPGTPNPFTSRPPPVSHDHCIVDRDFFQSRRAKLKHYR